MLADALRRDPIREALVISTCNRTEFYLATDDPDGAAVALRAAVERVKGVDLLPPGPSIYRLDDAAAIRHAFRVACGLDSMVLGEAQILSQLKDAYTWRAKSAPRAPVLDRLFESAFRAGKRARTETSIGAGVVSIASAACELARQGLRSLDALRVVVVGAGETSRLAAKHLARALSRRRDHREPDIRACRGARDPSLASPRSHSSGSPRRSRAPTSW